MKIKVNAKSYGKIVSVLLLRIKVEFLELAKGAGLALRS
jgi:hypothetical protein